MMEYKRNYFKLYELWSTINFELFKNLIIDSGIDNKQL